VLQLIDIILEWRFRILSNRKRVCAIIE